MMLTLDLTERFRRSYLPGFDCRLSALRNSLACQGHRESNAMVLGLSGTLCFVFAEAGVGVRPLPFHSVLGLTDQSIEGIATAFNAYASAGVQDPWEPFAHSTPAQWVAAGLPVHLAVHRSALRSARSGGGTAPPAGSPYDVGAHYVTVTAHEPKGGFTVFESDDPRPFTVDTAAFGAAWFYDLHHQRAGRDPVQPCAGRWFAVRVAGDVSMLQPLSARHAIHRVVHNFYYPSGSFIGTGALDDFASAVVGWADASSEPAVAGAIGFLPVFEGPLSGGGLGRKLYGRFLNEAATLLHDDTLRQPAHMFAESAERWRAFVADFRAAVRPPTTPGGVPRIDARRVAAAVDTHLAALVHGERAQMAWLRDWTAAEPIAPMAVPA